MTACKRHLRYGDGDWARCGKPWAHASHSGDESWPICTTCLRSCRELDKPPATEPDPTRDTAQTSAVDHVQDRCTLTGVGQCS